jgi:hypothetical protein
MGIIKIIKGYYGVFFIDTENHIWRRRIKTIRFKLHCTDFALGDI